MKVQLFNNKTSKGDIISQNGLILDSICKSCKITEELNGDFTVDLVFVNDNKYVNSIVEDSLLKIKDEYGDEYFRIAKVKKNKRIIEVFARQITISDTLTMWCEDVRPTELSGNVAINWIFNNAKGTNPFTVYSDITTISTAYYLNKNVYEALFTTDNSFLKRWGGEVKRNGFTLQINKKVGENRGVSIRSRKNLLGFEASTTLNNLTTRIYPKGYDGITIDEKYIDSPLINNYARIYAREVKFEDIRVNDEEYNEGYETLAQAQNEMKKRCNELFEIEKIDTINASYRIDFVELEKTEEYKDYSILEKTWLGDTINVVEENLDININVRVVKREYNVLKERRTNTELSNKNERTKPPTISDIVASLEKIPDTDNILSDAKKQATTLINAGMKNSYVVVRKNEILIMDSPDINTSQKIWRWNNGGLGYSSTGYYGEYGTAITNDGAIVANFITTGILNADLIKTGTITSKDGSISFDLQNGIIKTTNKDNQYIALEGGTIDFDGRTIIKHYTPPGEKPVLWWQDAIYKNDILYYGYLGLNFDNKVMFFGDVNDEELTTFLRGGKGVVVGCGKSSLEISKNGNTFFGDLEIQGDFMVTGNKNCIQKTEHYGNVSYYSVEDCESWLTDTSCETITVDENKQRVVMIDNVFKESVNLEKYIVEIYKIGWGDYRVLEKTKDYFIVESDREDFTFNYTIKAKRKGFENERLKEVYF